MIADNVEFDEVQWLIFPTEDDQTVWPLYLDEGLPPTSAVTSFGGNTADISRSSLAHPRANVGRILCDVDRYSATVRAGHRASFSAYFNAFPASYWQEWTDVATVRLTVRITDAAIVELFRSNMKGMIARVNGGRLEAGEHIFDVPLNRFGDGGWLWFDVEAEDSPVSIVSATWSVPIENRRVVTQTKVTAAITTYNLPEECLKQMERIAHSPMLMERLAELVIVDQGNRRLAEAPGFAEAKSELGGKFRVIEQPNLGGSGGFARGMYEMLRNPESDYVLLFDDDAFAEPESILRAVCFADYTTSPTIVGGNMFSLYERTVLASMGEVFVWEDFRWTTADLGPFFESTQGASIDLGVHRLRSTPALNRRVDVDYNGWWMCLIPKEVVENIGLSLPGFIKWDDVEYGLRAKEAGYPTVTLPGVAVWHAPWGEKEDTLDWQAYFHQRNRWVAALLHSPFPAGGKLAPLSLRTDVKHIVNMQYVANLLRTKGLEDVLLGPDHLHKTIAVRAADARRLMGELPEAKLYPNSKEFPKGTGGDRLKTDWARQPASLPKYFPLALRGAVHQFKRTDPRTLEAPQARIPGLQAAWWRLACFDSVLVENSEGSGAWWYRRKRDFAKQNMRKNLQLYWELIKRWDELAEQYRSALPEFTSVAAWKRTWGISTQD